MAAQTRTRVVEAVLGVVISSACVASAPQLQAPHRPNHEDLAPTIDVQPSPRAAELLPAHARYRIGVSEAGELAVRVIDARGAVVASLWILADDQPPASVGVTVAWDQRGDTATIAARSFAGAIIGEAVDDRRSARFWVRLGRDGSLAGERWARSDRKGRTEAEQLDWRRAQQIAADLAGLAEVLAEFPTEFPSDTHPDACALAERIALAELALDLGGRAWAGRGRAHLPSVTAFSPSSRRCPG